MSVLGKALQGLKNYGRKLTGIELADTSKKLHAARASVRAVGETPDVKRRLARVKARGKSLKSLKEDQRRRPGFLKGRRLARASNEQRADVAQLKKDFGPEVTKRRVAAEAREEAKKSMGRAWLGTAIGGGALVGGHKLLKSRKNSSPNEYEYAYKTAATNPLTITRGNMRVQVKPPNMAAGMTHKIKAPTPKTLPSGSTFKIKAPTPKTVASVKPPTPKPPNVSPGGLLRPGKNIVS